jgi:hypothetical protein
MVKSAKHAYFDLEDVKWEVPFYFASFPLQMADNKLE